MLASARAKSFAGRAMPREIRGGETRGWQTRELPDAHRGTAEREVKYPVEQTAKGVACKSVERDG